MKDSTFKRLAKCKCSFKLTEGMGRPLIIDQNDCEVDDKEFAIIFDWLSKIDVFYYSNFGLSYGFTGEFYLEDSIPYMQITFDASSDLYYYPVNLFNDEKICSSLSRLLTKNNSSIHDFFIDFEFTKNKGFKNFHITHSEESQKPDRNENTEIIEQLKDAIEDYLINTLRNDEFEFDVFCVYSTSNEIEADLRIIESYEINTWKSLLEET